MSVEVANALVHPNIGVGEVNDLQHRCDSKENLRKVKVILMKRFVFQVCGNSTTGKRVSGRLVDSMLSYAATYDSAIMICS